jgi:hypothetical protein
MRAMRIIGVSARASAKSERSKEKVTTNLRGVEEIINRSPVLKGALSILPNSYLRAWQPLCRKDGASKPLIWQAIQAVLIFSGSGIVHQNVEQAAQKVKNTTYNT